MKYKKKLLIGIIGFMTLISTGCNENEKKYIKPPTNVMGRYEENKEELFPRYEYVLEETHKVDGRQGIAYEKGNYYVSGSTTLSQYNKNWELVKKEKDPFKNIEVEVNHIGDIDIYNNEIYAGVEYFLDGTSKNIQIAIYNAKTLKLKKTYQMDPSSGQDEVSGIAIDPDTKSIWMCSWADGESGRYLYRYSLKNGKYLGKHHLQAAPQWIQGIAYLDGYIYITADDGNADLGEADHIYRTKIDNNKTTLPVFFPKEINCSNPIFLKIYSNPF